MSRDKVGPARERTAEDVRWDPQPGDRWIDHADGVELTVMSRDGARVTARRDVTMVVGEWAEDEADGAFVPGVPPAPPAARVPVDELIALLQAEASGARILTGYSTQAQQAARADMAADILAMLGAEVPPLDDWGEE